MKRRISPHIKVRYICITSLIASISCIISFSFPLSSFAVPGDPQFTDIQISKAYSALLLSNPDFMVLGGAQLVETEDGALALIGIGKVFPEKGNKEPIGQLSRKGEIRARAAILELSGDVEIQTSRGQYDTASRQKKALSLSSFFQTTATKVEDEIQQLPIIGTWWAKDKEVFNVAVGKMVQGNEQTIDQYEKEIPPAEVDLHNLEGDEPFISLIKLSPLLQQSGGVKAFQLDDSRKVLIAVSSTPIKDSIAAANNIARLKAVRTLLGVNEGITMSSAEYLSDMEHIQITSDREQHVLLSEFLSVQKEHLSGEIKALPIVAKWEDSEGLSLYVAIGRIFEGEGKK